MSSGILTFPPITTERLEADTDVASFVFKWHPEFAPGYVRIIQGSELVVSFMTISAMRQGALNAKWGSRKTAILEEYLAEFVVLHSGDAMCSIWADVRHESVTKGRQMGSADAWIAAAALLLGTPLVTNTPKHYRHLEKLQIISLS